MVLLQIAARQVLREGSSIGLQCPSFLLRLHLLLLLSSPSLPLLSLSLLSSFLLRALLLLYQPLALFLPYLSIFLSPDFRHIFLWHSLSLLFNLQCDFLSTLPGKPFKKSWSLHNKDDWRSSFPLRSCESLQKTHVVIPLWSTHPWWATERDPGCEDSWWTLTEWCTAVGEMEFAGRETCLNLGGNWCNRFYINPASIKWFLVNIFLYLVDSFQY